jgi:hypothetical protein
MRFGGARDAIGQSRRSNRLWEGGSGADGSAAIASKAALHHPRGLSRHPEPSRRLPPGYRGSFSVRCWRQKSASVGGRPSRRSGMRDHLSRRGAHVPWCFPRAGTRRKPRRPGLSHRWRRGGVAASNARAPPTRRQRGSSRCRRCATRHPASRGVAGWVIEPHHQPPSGPAGRPRRATR